VSLLSFILFKVIESGLILPKNSYYKSKKLQKGKKFNAYKNMRGSLEKVLISSSMELIYPCSREDHSLEMTDRLYLKETK
jgi:predicted metalloendopeptidase